MVKVSVPCTYCKKSVERSAYWFARNKESNILCFDCKRLSARYRYGKDKSRKCVFCEYKTDRENRLCLRCSIVIYRRDKYIQIEETDGACVTESGFGYKFLRRYMLDRRFNICEICGMKSWLGKKINLVVDHKNGLSDDNSLSNLRLICNGCDATLPTFKNKNRGRARLERGWR